MENFLKKLSVPQDKQKTGKNQTAKVRYGGESENNW